MVYPSKEGKEYLSPPSRSIGFLLSTWMSGGCRGTGAGESGFGRRKESFIALVQKPPDVGKFGEVFYIFHFIGEKERFFT
jgi:hypothetical protein